MRKFGLKHLLTAGGFALASSFLAVPARAEGEAREIFRIMLDEARLLRLDVPAQTLVIGNAAIADAAVNDGRTIIITGKSFGTTNLLALDRAGKVIAERQIEVQQPGPSILTVQRGGASESYSCTPNCRPTPVIGDSAATFDTAIDQASKRNGWAQSGGSK